MTLKRIFNRSFGSKYKIFSSPAAALYDVFDGCTILIGGFGCCGAPENSLKVIADMKCMDLTLITNAAAGGHSQLLTNGQVSKYITTFVGGNDVAEKMYWNGQYILDLIPQGTLAEGFRAAQAGIGGFYTLAGYGTVRTEGTFDIKCMTKTSPAITCTKKETREFNGRQYLLEQPHHGDFSIIKAYISDRKGNLRYRKTARNFNPDIAGASQVTIAEVEHIVDEIPPERIQPQVGLWIEYTRLKSTPKKERL